MENVEYGQYNLSSSYEQPIYIPPTEHQPTQVSQFTPKNPSSQLIDISGNISVKDILSSSGVPQKELQKISGPSETKIIINEPRPNIIDNKSIEYNEDQNLYNIRSQLQHIVRQIIGNVASDDYINMLATAMINKSLYDVSYSNETENVIKLINQKILKFVTKM